MEAKGSPFEIKVDCYSGYKGEERPVKFTLGQREIQVEDILDRWYSPNSSDFKVKGSDAKVYILRKHHETPTRWTLQSLVGSPEIS
jgi:hypothetical protein